MKWTLVLWAVGAIVSCNPMAKAEVKLIQAEAREGREIRDAAGELLRRMSFGEDKEARELFAGEAPQKEVLEAYLKLVPASEAVRKSKRGRFEGAKVDFPIADMLRGISVVNELRSIICNGDEAAFGTDVFPRPSLRLKRIDGKWRVTHLVPPRDADRTRDVILVLAEAMSQVSGGLDGGSITDEAGINATFRKWMEGAWDKYDRSGREMRRQAPLARPLSGSVSGNELRELIDGDADRVNRFIALLPGLPEMVESPERVWLHSREAGIELVISRITGKGQSLHVHLQAGEGYAAYQGQWPMGLSSTDTRRQLERRFGQPGSSGGTKEIGYSAYYTKHGFSLTYSTDDMRDPKARLCEVSFRLPDPSAPATRPADTKASRLEFRLVVEKADPADRDVEWLADPDSPRRAEIAVRREVLLDGSSILAAFMVPAMDEQGDWVSLEFTDEGGKKLEQISAQHSGRRLALVVDGQVVIAASIAGKMSKHLRISIGTRGDLRKQVDLGGRIHAAVFALPAEAEQKP